MTVSTRILDRRWHLRAFRRAVVSTPGRAAIAASAVVALCTAGQTARHGPALHLPPANGGDALGLVRPLYESPCPARTLPDGDACVRLVTYEDGPELELAQNEHRDAHGHWTVYEEIPRRPDRTADYDAYRYPVPCDHACVVSGYDLDQPDEKQRRGRFVGHGAVDLAQKKGTPILMLRLEHQQGDAEVVYVGPLFGLTVITRHALLEAGQLRNYLLLFGHMDAQAPDVKRGAHLGEGALLGFVGDSGSPSLIHLHLEVRRLRAGVEVGKLTPAAMINNEGSVACDPRNVLPLRMSPP